MLEKTIETSHAPLCISSRVPLLVELVLACAGTVASRVQISNCPVLVHYSSTVEYDSISLVAQHSRPY
jgi:hypothetical protein